MKIFLPTQNGSVLIEVVIAVSIIAIAFIQLTSAVQRSLTLSTQSLRMTQASFLLEEGAEATRTIRDTSWATLYAAARGIPYQLSFSSGAWSLSGSSQPIDGFTRTVTFSDVYRDGSDKIAASGTLDAGTIRADVTLNWQNGSASASRTLPLYLSDIFN